MSEPNPPISPKVPAAAVAGAVTTLVVWLIQVIFDVDVPGVVEAAIATIAASLGAYLKHDPLQALGALTARHEGRHEL